MRGFLGGAKEADDPADSYLFRLTSFINSSLGYELNDLDGTVNGASRIEDLLCRMCELAEMGGVRLFAPSSLRSADLLRA